MTNNNVILLPVFVRYDACRIDIKKLQRILDVIERSVERYKHKTYYQDYLTSLKRQAELVRECYGFEDRESVDPFDYLVRDNLDRQDNVPQARPGYKVKSDNGDPVEHAV
jgi:hypothetical protein